MSKKVEILDLPCTNCNYTFKDVTLTEDSEIKCPQCGAVYILNKETLKELFQEFLKRSHGERQARDKK
ncbi:MAG: hypothetical protein IPL26_19770 [Leptospiraceae bacterium]|nr:hypothetical protein [Leptospiraceae bacterium]